ncbi:MAG: PstS family phosphate ABC transporter substrate-binding protein [Aureliella sp.]
MCVRFIVRLIPILVFIVGVGSLPHDLHGQTLGSQREAFESALPIYQATVRLESKRLKAVGSETMSGVMRQWIEGFQKVHSGIAFEVDSKGSNNAFPALIRGQADWGLMSRSPRRSEVAEFKERFGYEPLVIPTAIDLMAVYVHRSNPINQISLPELDAIFSGTRRLGARRRASFWGDFTTEASYQRQPIECYGRNSVSGTFEFFQENVLARGDFGPWVNQLSSSARVVESVSERPNSIGYSAIVFQSDSVKPLAIAAERGGKAVEPNSENAYNGSYPLARFLYLLLNRDPVQGLSETQTEFLRFVFSRQGQEVVKKIGFVPLPAEIAEQMLTAALSSP